MPAKVGLIFIKWNQKAGQLNGGSISDKLHKFHVHKQHIHENVEHC